MTRSSSFGSIRRVAVTVACAVVTASCDELFVPPVEDVPPSPGFVISTPAEVRTLHDVAVIAADHTGITSAFAVGTDGTILHFDGRRWDREESGVDVDLESVSGVLDGDGVEQVFAVGAEGTALHRRRDGGVWEAVSTGVVDHLFGVWVRSADDAFAVGDNGRILRWDGEVMLPLVDEVLIETGAVDENDAPIAFPIADPLKSVMGRDSEVFAVGPRGSVYRFDGTRFRREDTATNRPLVDVFTRAGVWAAATDGVLLRRRDGVWRDDEFIVPIPVFLQGIWSRGDGDVFAVGLSPEVFHLENGAWTITSAGVGVALRAIDGVELPSDPDAEPPAAGEEPPPVVRQILAVGAGGRVVRGPLVVPDVGEVALVTVAAED
jgi:photosystem II stability/assembly factor-like uncharacterized protein